MSATILGYIDSRRRLCLACAGCGALIHTFPWGQTSSVLVKELECPKCKKPHKEQRIAGPFPVGRATITRANKGEDHGPT